MDYEATGNALVDRIKASAKDHPEILSFDSPWQLFKVPGFQCEDLQPSYAQACAALAIVQRDAQKVSAQ